MKNVIQLQRAQAAELARTLHTAILGEVASTLAAVSSSAAGPAQRVHGARKHLKRWRALVRLLPAAMRARMRREERALHLLARRLGQLRDPIAQRETWRDFATDSRARGEMNDVEQLLARRAARLASEVRIERLFVRASRILLAVQPNIGRALTERRLPDKPGLGALCRHARKSYAKARRALVTALETTTSESVHALRRANKVHQYQLEFLQPLWEKPLRARRKRASALSDTLGRHHDLTAIAELLWRERRAQPLAFAADLARIERCKAELEQTGFHDARLIYAEKPRAFARRVHAYLIETLRDDRASSSAAAE
ncbi:MAG TPA: CHAD domain-containing protein [Polyangiaceae bacterium]|jgi:CHAD domain-containing protein